MIEERENIIIEEGNNLFPVFLKLETLRLLIIGGGNVGLEKLIAVTENSPSTFIHLVSITIQDKIYELSKDISNIIIEERAYTITDIEQADIIIAAVNDIKASEQIRHDAHQKGKLVNVADKPELCDFYLSSIVKKGNLKIAISTNGKSPTIARRVKEVLNETIPDEIDELLNNMQNFRNKMSDDFAEKVKKLNELTRSLTEEN